MPTLMIAGRLTIINTLAKAALKDEEVVGTDGLIETDEGSGKIGEFLTTPAMMEQRGEVAEIEGVGRIEGDTHPDMPQ
ncbi:MAG: hypothetical protein PVF76_07805 [Syntrophobacterales bacterium]